MSGISGTYNETLTVSETISAVNLLANMTFDVDGKRYEIESNTTSAITLKTPTSSYVSLSGKTLSIERASDYFPIYAKSGEYDDIASILSTSSISVVTADLNYILPRIEGKIYDKIHKILSKGDFGYDEVKDIIIGLAAMWLTRRRIMKINITPDQAIFQWQTCPDFTANMKQTLERIVNRARMGSDKSRIFERDTGEVSFRT